MSKMLVADICWRTGKQIPTNSYYKKTFEIEGNYICITSTEIEEWIAREEQKIRKECGFDLVDIKINRYYY